MAGTKSAQPPKPSDANVRSSLQRSEASLQLLAAQLPVLIWTTNHELRITSIVGAEQVQPERPPEWCLGKTLQAILGPEAAGLPVIPAHSRALCGEAAQYERRAAGRVFDVRVQPLRDQRQQVVGCLGLALDITERTRSEGRLATQYAVSRTLARATRLEDATPGLLRAIGESLEWDCGALWVLDQTAGALVCQELWHGAAQALDAFAGLTRAARCTPGLGIPGHVWEHGQPIWLTDLDAASHLPRIAAAAAAGLQTSFGLPILLNDQVVGVLEFFSRRPHEPDQATLEFVTSLGQQVGQFLERTRAEAERAAAERRLLTQRLEAEYVADRERLRRDLIGSVSHDLRTPLTATRAALGLLESSGGSLAPVERQLLDNARRSLERLRLLVDDLVAANQLLAEAPPPAVATRLDLRAVVEAAVGPLAPLIERRGQALAWELPTPLPVMGDPEALRHVVSNLLANAHYHTGPGTRVALIGWQAQGTVRLAVHDDGPGITPEVAASLFQPLHRLGAEAVGSGLGLAVARSIVEQHGGRLWYEPAPERGVIFHLALPSAPE
jgi:two-component system cell cycle sensor histidine kinase/response regulator CckA